MSATSTNPVTNDNSSTDDDLVHYVCCDDTTAYCLTPLDGGLTDEDASCVVCVDLALDLTYCPKFGRCCQ